MFKKLFYQRLVFVVLVLVNVSLFAQNVPTATATPPAATPVALPAAYSSATVNYIRTWQPNKKITDPTMITTTTNVADVKQQTQYFDGLGRLLETVSKAVSPLGHDVVAPVVYDAYGREQYT